MPEPKAIQLSQFQEFDSRRVVSKLLYDSDKCRVVLFCLEPDQEVPPHESSSEVIFYGVEGKGSVLVGADRVGVAPGTIVVCPPMLPHGIKATERVTVLAVIAPRPG
jgi:quercetin dioxygenase-like cupin family protein